MKFFPLRAMRSAMIGLALFSSPAFAQQESAAPRNVPPASESAADVDFDTSYRPSASMSTRIQREFIESIRWSAGPETRNSLGTAFSEKSHLEIWQELVAKQGLTTNNVADALTAYWVLNWITANGAYTAEIDNAPIQRQLRAAFAADANFIKLNDQQKQRIAENYILNFLLEHAALNQAVAARDVDMLTKLALASVARFQRDMGVNLLALVPSAEGFAPRARE